MQGLHWLDERHQLVFYNPLTHPSDPPEHQYQASLISNTASLSPFNYTYSKFAMPPIDAFGNTDLQPWFYFQSLHAWTPQIKALTLCSVTAGSDIGLVGLEPSGTWRTWSIEDESRRATVPYDMDANKETICAGMALDFTATKKLEKPLYPDEMPGECEALPILWVCNTAGQLAGWTVIYREGVKAAERALEMKNAEVQETYWKQEREKMVREVEPSDKDDRELWEKEWRNASPEGAEAVPRERAPAPASVDQSPPTAKLTTPAPTTPQQTTATPTTVQTPLQKPSPTTSTATFGKPSPLGSSPLGTTFGQPSQLGGALPGQSGMYPGFISTSSRPQPVFGQSTGLGTFGSSPSSSTGTTPGFGKYSPQSGSGFLGAGAKPGSFLQGATSGASFLSSSTGQGFQKPANQGFAKYASPNQGFGQYASPRGFGTPDSMTTPSSFAESKSFLGPTATSTKSPFGETALGSLSQRTQKYTSPSSRTPAFSDESTTESEASEEDSDSEDEAPVNVPVEALGLGDGGFNLSLGESRHHLAPTTPLKSEGGKTQVSPSMESVSSMGEEYVKVGLPVTPSPHAGKNITPSGMEKTAASNLSPVAPPVLAPPVTSGSSTLTPSPLAPPRVIEKAAMPLDPVIPAPRPEKSVALPQVTPPQRKSTAVEVTKAPAVPISAPARNKVEIRTTAQAAPTTPVSSRSADTAVYPLPTPISLQELSDAFRLVVEQVSQELVKVPQYQ
jgi:hypothetical protein